MSRMTDLISRQAAIDAFDCTGELIVTGNENAQNVMNYINKVVGKIKALPSANPEIIKCKDCRWWEKYDDTFGYCHAAKHGHWSEHWDIRIWRVYRGDFYCADAELRLEEEDEDEAN